MSGTQNIYDVIIVGGGPAGLNAALMLGRACKRVVVVDAGKPRNAAARALHGFLGRDGTKPRDLLADGRRELLRYQVEVLDDIAVDAECMPMSGDYFFATGFRILTKKGQMLKGRKLLFATGTCDEIPDIPGLTECYGSTVHHCPYCDGWEHRGKHLLAYGSQPAAAVGLGISLLGWSSRVTVLASGKPLTDSENIRLVQNGIACAHEKVLGLLHEGTELRGVKFEGGRQIDADVLFFNTGQRPHCSLPIKLGCESGEDRFAHTREKQKTNVPGLFLAGDADGDVQFVIVAAGEGATAAVAINRELQDEDGDRSMKSSNSM